jgi:hypothetical protein
MEIHQGGSLRFSLLVRRFRRRENRRKAVDN